METYQLHRLPRQLRRSANRATTAVMLGMAAALSAAMLTVEGAGPGIEVWIGLMAVEAVIGASSWNWYRQLPESSRTALREAHRRVLPPTPLSGHADPIVVPLRPGVIRRRRLRHRPDLLVIRADREGMEIPTWMLVSPHPRTRQRDWVRVGWIDVERWRVTSDSEGPDTYEITLALHASTVWDQPPRRRPTRLRVRRDEICDEVVLLDYVRSVGARTVDLETSVDSGARALSP